MKQFEFNDFIYTTEIVDKKIIFGVEKRKGNPPPSHLSKYYPISEFSLEAIENNHFYISHPEDLNDLFDFSYYLFHLDNLPLEQIKSFLKDGDLSEKEIEQKYLTKKSELIEIVKFNFYGLMLSKVGIICFTPNKYSDLMWGYYGNNEGFCIEFDYNLFTTNIDTRFHGPFPINYVESLSKIDMNKLEAMTLLIQSTIKKNDWKHEDEYRFIIETSNTYEVNGLFSNKEWNIELKPRLIKYPTKSVKGVYLGFNFSKNDDKTEGKNKNECILTLTSNNKKLKNRLLKSLINNNYRTFTIGQDTSTFQLKDKEVKIEYIEENKFLITSLN